MSFTTYIEFRGAYLNFYLKSESSYTNYEQMLLEPKFITWIKSLEESKLDIKYIEITKIDMFGKKIGFIHGVVNSMYAGKMMPGIFVLRGQSVAFNVLIKNTDTNEIYIALTKQPRIPVGRSNLIELIAGMNDGQSFISQGLNELKEEAGINIQPYMAVDLYNLFQRFVGNTQLFEGFLTSPGLIDENIGILCVQLLMNTAEITLLNNKLTGEEDEAIEVQILPYNSKLFSYTNDSKMMLAYFMYETVKHLPEFSVWHKI